MLTLHRTAPRTLRAALLAGVLLAALPERLPGGLAPDSAHAQPSREIESIEPSWFVVSSPDAALRSGNTSRFYPVATLRRGQVVRVDGRASERGAEGEIGWSRVVYPEDVPVLVVAGDAEPAGEGFVRLTRPSRLRAWSQATGVAGSWRSVYDPAVPAGRLLPLVREVRDDADAVTGYLVEPISPPNAAHPARGFVRTDTLRPATPEEIRAHLGEPPTQATGPASQPANQPSSQPPSQPATQPATQPNADQMPGASPRTGDPQPSARPGTQPGAQSEAEPTPGAASPATGEPEPAQPPIEVVAREVEGLPTPAELRDLENAFDALRRQSKTEQDAALDELLAEYRRTRAALDLSVPGASGVAVSLDRRIQWLELRQRTRDERLALLRELGEVDARLQRSGDRAEAWRAGRGFDLVGRVERSSVYDGVNLPLMYRLVADDPVAGRRTVGYIRATPGDADVSRLVGQTVGVRGSGVRDAQLGLLLLDPRDIEVMPR